MEICKQRVNTLSDVREIYLYEGRAECGLSNQSGPSHLLCFMISGYSAFMLVPMTINRIHMYQEREWKGNKRAQVHTQACGTLI